MKVIGISNGDTVQKGIVMDLLGSSVESLMTKNKKLQLKSIIKLAIMMLDVIKHIHTCGYIHRDIKPDNFALGYGDPRKLYCIDFGLAKRYVKRNGEHIQFSDKRKFCGTARYASIAAHKQTEQSRKDDLESIAYVLVYLFKGSLPWQGIKHKDKQERYRLIGEKKEQMSEEDICKDMPREFVVFLKWIRQMEFDEKPPYSSFRRLFEKLYKSRNYQNDKLEWE